MDRATNPAKSFQVVVRLCPQKQKDQRTDETRSSINVVGPNRIVVDTGRGHQPHSLDFDAVLDESTTQKDVYESTVKPLVGSLMRGYNGCVIVYGSPGTGKTYTMLGNSISGKQRGILSRAAEDIFNSPEASYCRVRVSFYHISNEKIYDLLESQMTEVCRIHDGEELVQLEGLKEVEVSSAQTLLHLYRRGAANRNAGISRGDFASKSHAIFNIVVINTKLQFNNEGMVTASKLTLVDLASSGKGMCCSTAAMDIKKSLQTCQENPQEAKTLKRSLAIFRNAHDFCPQYSQLSTCSIQGVQTDPSSERMLSTVTETLSCLQLASRAMAMPGRPIHRSQLPCSPLRVLSVRACEKNAVPVNRQLAQVPASNDRRFQSQTCLPPIPSGPGPQLRPGQRRSEESDHLAFLPQLDKPGLTQGPQEKCGAVDSRLTHSLSRSQSSGLVHPVPWRSVERLSSSSLGSSAPPTLPSPTTVLLECPGCRRERKLREDYDKVVMQVRKDKDTLNQRVAELEAALQKIGSEEPKKDTVSTTPHTTTETAEKSEVSLGPEKELDEVLSLRQALEVNRDDLLYLETENNHLKIQLVCLQREVESLRIQLDQCEEREKALADRLHAEQSLASQKTQELRDQLETARAQNTQDLSTLHNQWENLLAELQDTKEEHERFRENVAYTVSQLHKEKVELISHIEDTRRNYEKVRSENAGLREQVEALLKETNSSTHPGPHGNTGSPQIHTVTANTEMLVLSHHHVSQQCTTSTPQEGKCYCNHCSGLGDKSELQFTDRPSDPRNMSDYEPGPKSKNAFKQLRREHNLLLDVMLILYRREWFVQDAMPYVKRTLRKCGIGPEDLI